MQVFDVRPAIHNFLCSRLAIILHSVVCISLVHGELQEAEHIGDGSVILVAWVQRHWHQCGGRELFLYGSCCLVRESFLITHTKRLGSFRHVAISELTTYPHNQY